MFKQQAGSSSLIPTRALDVYKTGDYPLVSNNSHILYAITGEAPCHRKLTFLEPLI